MKDKFGRILGPRPGPFPWVMNTELLGEKLDAIPKEQKVTIFKEIIIRLAQYHSDTYDARAGLANDIEEIIMGIE